MTTVTRSLLVVAPLLAGGVAAGAWFAWQRPPGPTPVVVAPRPPVSVPSRAEALEGRGTARPPDPPRFDVARIGARGAVVTAGRAAPGAEVILLDDGREIGRARADNRGEWVILPAEPALPGARELSLRARLPDGQEAPGTDTVLMVVPGSPALPGGSRGAVPGRAPGAEERAGTPLVLLLPPPGATGSAPRPLSNAPPAAAELAVDVVDYDTEGNMRFAGSASPGAELRFYADDRHLGGARAGSDGRWSFSPSHLPPPGQHRLRVDQAGAGAGSFVVAARAEVVFRREDAGAAVPRDGRVVVQPGHNLWRIARQTYGRGARFTLIYAANREQIRDPRRIYPGQLLGLPEESGGEIASPSRTR